MNPSDMSIFDIGYSVFMVAGFCLAAASRSRQAISLFFIFALIVGLCAYFGGREALTTLAKGVGILVAVAIVSYLFRQLLVLLLPGESSKAMRTAPLTAAFGMLVVLLYAIAGIFAPWIAPYPESAVITSPFAPADDAMLLGADQLGRDMFSRVIFGARNTVGIALLATTLAFIVGAICGLIAAIKGGFIDQLFGRIADVIMSIPSLIFSLSTPREYSVLPERWRGMWW